MAETEGDILDEDPYQLPAGEDGFDPNSPVAAMVRLRDQLRSIHPQAAVIITAHAALEQEVDQLLRSLVPHPSKLPRLSIDHQLGVIRSILNDEWLGFVLDAVAAYGGLRNSIAHKDKPVAIVKAITRLGERTEKIGCPLEPGTNFGALAMGIAAALHVGAEGYRISVSCSFSVSP